SVNDLPVSDVPFGFNLFELPAISNNSTPGLEVFPEIYKGPLKVPRLGTTAPLLGLLEQLPPVPTQQLPGPIIQLESSLDMFQQLPAPPPSLNPFPTQQLPGPPASLNPFPTQSPPPASLNPFPAQQLPGPPASLNPFPTQSPPPASLNPFPTQQLPGPPASLNPFPTQSPPKAPFNPFLAQVPLSPSSQPISANPFAHHQSKPMATIVIEPDVAPLNEQQRVVANFMVTSCGLTREYIVKAINKGQFEIVYNIVAKNAMNADMTSWGFHPLSTDLSILEFVEKRLNRAWLKNMRSIYTQFFPQFTDQQYVTASPEQCVKYVMESAPAEQHQAVNEMIEGYRKLLTF